jgi:hypothetical protein
VQPLLVRPGEVERDEAAVGDSHEVHPLLADLVEDQREVAGELRDRVRDVALGRLALAKKIVEDDVIRVAQHG